MNPYTDAVERPTTRLAEAAGISKRLQYRVAQLGYRHLTRGRLDKARVIFQGLAQLDPYDAWYQLALGSVAQRAGDLSGAEGFYSKALRLNPYAVSGWANRGEVRLLSGKGEEGISDLKRAVELDPKAKDPSALRARALLAAVTRS